MRKPIALIVITGALTLSAKAQDGFYLSPSLGVGATNVKQNYSYTNASGNTITRSSLINYNAKIGIGYKYKSWRFQTGLQYLQTGYELNDLLFSSVFDPSQPVATGAGEYQLRFHHLGIPLQVGYVIQPKKKFSLVPSIGILTTYNLMAKSSLRADNNAESRYTWSRERFNNEFNRFSLWGTANLHLEYKLNNKITFFAGPSIQYMISNFEKNPENAMIKSRQRNYTINLDLGVHIGL